MDTAALSDIEAQLRQLRPEQLALLSQVIRSLSDPRTGSERVELLLAAESSLRKDWDGPEEDAAWADL